ncbi:hypothetical protein IW140_002436 [Coemansia sp. RSA 1813]|nr:hypothetical protein EV178_000937 [Coemansia sp. RSA 1646]KAJ1773040.1 hypothetical protein LPJ74_000991 [Coemansia sp. RSA 1843]KAJ2092184.1 hypothetical protein IW138_001251 [Coemansia sp. RSA 986]KAJ2215321.1 hypothetical protein EV179_002269 [Coemansia sp. RSA 487]KAJ2570343.1 hypothetical protein IW140_002436 [Coemansia sp. RSA 1813]
MAPVAVVGGVVVVFYMRRTALYQHSEAAYVIKPEASKRLKILHDQAAKLSQGMQRRDTEESPPVASSLASHIVRLLAPECWLFLGVTLTAVGAAIVNLWTPVVTGDLINVIARSVRLVSAMDESVLEALKSPARKLLALFVANGLLTFAHTTLVTVLGERIGLRLHMHALGTLLSHDLAFFDAAAQSGALISRVSMDIAEFQSTFKKIVTQGLKSATLTVGVVWQLLRLSPHLTFTLVSTMPVAYFALAYYGKFLRTVRKSAKEWDAISTGIAGEAIGNIRTVRALSAEAAELELYKEARNEASASSNRFGLHMGAFRGLTNTAIGAMVLLVLYNGGRLVSRGDMSPGDLMAFMIATQHAQKALDSLGSLMGQTVRAKSAVSRVLEIIHLVPTVPHTGGARLPITQGHIRFMDVDFAYPTRPDAPVLERFNLDIPAGQVVALCGASGSGKSTVAALLERFYDPSAGEIWLDACPLKRLDPSWHRAQIGFIPQEPALFSTSVRENLRLAQPGATDEEIEEACRQANAHDFVVAFPHGYDTVVGERGTLLSGGQKQRLSIARAILRNPRILILDEATSSLDAHSERLVQSALDNLMVGRTVLVIAHRLTTIRNADRIVVMGKVPGHIVEQGSHSELIERRGAYYKLYNDATAAAAAAQASAELRDN